MIEDRIVTEILDGVAANDLGIQEGYQILKVDGKSIPTSKLNEYLESKDDFEFEIQVILMMYKVCWLCYFFIKTQPLEDRIIRFYRKKLHNEDPPHFKIVRKQFPVRLTYSMTINKAQGMISNKVHLNFQWGQTLKKVGLYLKKNVFSHGQLYVAFSRVSDPKDITVFLDEDENQHGWINESAYTKNVVFSNIVDDEVEKFKKSDDYGIGPLEFTDGKFCFEIITFVDFWDNSDPPPKSDFTFDEEDSSTHDIEFSDSDDFGDKSESFSDQNEENNYEGHCFIRIPCPNSDSEPSFSPPRTPSPKFVSSPDWHPSYWEPWVHTTDDEKQQEEDFWWIHYKNSQPLKIVLIFYPFSVELWDNKRNLCSEDLWSWVEVVVATSSDFFFVLHIRLWWNLVHSQLTF